MTRELFVFIQLPGATTPVVAGRFAHEDSISPPLGTFIYGKSYLRNIEAVPIDPVALPLREAEFRTTLTEGFFGAIRDALPDDWGRHVIQKLHGDDSRTTFGFLLLPSADRFGALSFGTDSAAQAKEPEIARLEGLTNNILVFFDKIDRDGAITDAERRAAIAFGAGTHAGGARPKLTVRDENGIWLAKLNRFDDRANAVRIEAAMLDLAAACGISVPEHRVEAISGKDVLLVRRFDRRIADGQVLKNRAASAATVFQADEAHARAHFTGSYMRLSRELSRWCVGIASDRHELYRRMAFNCLAGITDDHERNHALVAESQHFRLAPAFDLSPVRPTTRRRRQSLPIGAEGDESTRFNLLSVADQFDLDPRKATETIDAVKHTIDTRWRTALLAGGVSERDIEHVSPCFNHDYFEGG